MNKKEFNKLKQYDILKLKDLNDYCLYLYNVTSSNRFNFYIPNAKNPRYQLGSRHRRYIKQLVATEDEICKNCLVNMICHKPMNILKCLDNKKGD